MFKAKTWGPFRIYRGKDKKEGKNFLGLYLTAYPDSPWGWEWGSDANEYYLPILIRILGLSLFGFKKDKKGFELRLLGFWWLS